MVELTSWKQYILGTITVLNKSIGIRNQAFTRRVTWNSEMPFCDEHGLAVPCFLLPPKLPLSPPPSHLKVYLFLWEQRGGE